MAQYIANDQDSDKDMIDDIIHEIAHSVEEMYGHGIYDDGSVEREFLGKRKDYSQTYNLMIINHQ